MAILEDRSVLLLGAASPLGAALLTRFTTGGARVLQPAALTRDSLPALAAEAEAAAVETVIVIATPGEGASAGLEATGPALWSGLLEQSVSLPYLLIRAMLPGLRQRRGQVVLVGSSLGLTGQPRAAAAGAAMGAMVGLTRALALELAPEVRVNLLCPGPLETDSLWPEVAAVVPQQRRGRVEEVVAAVLFAADPACGFLTGSVIPIDGGLTAGRRPA